MKMETPYRPIGDFNHFNFDSQSITLLNIQL
jgi:hypothetical protein